MSQIINATFRNGVFVPDGPVQVAAGARVKLIVEPAAAGEASAIEPLEADAGDGQQPRPIDAFLKFCEEHPIHSGVKLTRDELHERD